MRSHCEDPEFVEGDVAISGRSLNAEVTEKTKEGVLTGLTGFTGFFQNLIHLII